MSTSTTEGQQHPLGIYFQIWILLFVLSGFSYAVDYFQFEGYLRWFLVVVFMMLKAGLIVAVLTVSYTHLTLPTILRV